MADISAAKVIAFRKRTGLPMMDCKKALAEAGGDEDAAVELLRKRGQELADKRGDRETAFGTFGLYFNLDPGVGAMVELQCESAPVTRNEDFMQLASDLAQQLATGPGASTADELLAQPSPSKSGSTLGDQKDELANQIREIFNVGRVLRIDGPCGGYVHQGTTVHGAVVEVSGGNSEAARDICMHIAAMNPAALNTDDLDPALVDKEREILRDAALQEGKPENIVDKMVEGRLRNFYAERVLTEQPFVKAQKMTVGNFAKENSMEIKQFVHWELGQE